MLKATLTRSALMSGNNKNNSNNSNKANQQNANKGSAGTNKAYDKAQGNRGKQLNPNQK